MQKFRAVAKKMAKNFRGYFFAAHCIYDHWSRRKFSIENEADIQHPIQQQLVETIHTTILTLKV